MRVLTVERAELDATPGDAARDGAARADAEHRDAVRGLAEGTLQAVIVRGVIDPVVLAVAMERIVAGTTHLPRVEVPVLRGWLLGRPLVAAAGSSSFLDEAARFREASAALLGVDLDACLAGALGAISGGRPVTIARVDGRACPPATFRVLVDGDALPLHYEDETLGRPALAPLLPPVVPPLLSFYLPVALPRAGGALRLSPITHAGDGATLLARLGSDAAARPTFDAAGWTTLSPCVGDLLVFDGGRHYHEVTPVEGGPRCTLGGFLALTADGGRVHYWG